MRSVFHSAAVCGLEMSSIATIDGSCRDGLKQYSKSDVRWDRSQHNGLPAFARQFLTKPIRGHLNQVVGDFSPNNSGNEDTEHSNNLKWGRQIEPVEDKPAKTDHKHMGEVERVRNLTKFNEDVSTQIAGPALGGQCNDDEYDSGRK